MWARFVNAALGIWLMASPAVLGYGPPASTNDRIVGPLVATMAIIAIWQVTRPLRWVNLVLGGWLVAAPWLLGYGQWPVIVNSVAAGLAVFLLSLVRGKTDQRYGGGWSAVWKKSKGR